MCAVRRTNLFLAGANAQNKAQIDAWDCEKWRTGVAAEVEGAMVSAMEKTTKPHETSTGVFTFRCARIQTLLHPPQPKPTCPNKSTGRQEVRRERESGMRETCEGELRLRMRRDKQAIPRSRLRPPNRSTFEPEVSPRGDFERLKKCDISPPASFSSQPNQTTEAPPPPVLSGSTTPRLPASQASIRLAHSHCHSQCSFLKYGGSTSVCFSLLFLYGSAWRLSAATPCSTHTRAVCAGGSTMWRKSHVCLRVVSRKTAHSVF